MQPILEHHRIVDPSVPSTQSAPAIRHASTRSVETHVLARVALEHDAMSLTIRRSVHANPDIPEIRLQTAILNLLHLVSRSETIHAIRLRVEQMHNVLMVYALACQNIKAIRIGDVDLNVYSIRNVHAIKHVSVANVSTLVRELVDRMLFVKS